ncbi:sugar ABC transporter substrate-binding protein [Dactylosporangium matsuzakiense]|uniref:Sugar ABC transporter substrate-binding protein n=1 Tax=Dactylosporangium matsuzakiense TaxID=53360 RepID=A0A9W6NSM1_9ACTN|nr:substrate-binding domain-containing protein [Dactylosporangium matsuzakiense]UWZ48974.1 substrate-binding domain-containing protein [Dactylosporangium matsuzakiense]GLL07784.1 sugar ABC transporter substrate-binding protein [Dactylosporangium matsuzakiense]
MRRGILSLLAIGALAASGTAACTANVSGAGSRPRIGVILPDSKSSARWETADRKYLAAAFKAAGVDYEIQNAQNDKSAFTTLAEQMITQGVDVLMIVNLDSGTGKAVLDKARNAGVATIDYDRLTLGGSARYYVSFDNAAVGTLQGQGLVKCLTDAKATRPVIAELNGSQTDNNSTLFKEGYDGVLGPKFTSGEYQKGPDQWIEEWDNTRAGTAFEQMMTAQPDIGGVIAANDGLANAAINVLKKQGLNGHIPVTGQDATAQGLQNILAGDQCMTVYKDVRREAAAAAKLAIALAKGETGVTTAKVYDRVGKRDVDAILLDPKAITRQNVRDVIDDGYVAADEVCTGEFAARCAAAGIK